MNREIPKQQLFLDWTDIDGTRVPHWWLLAPLWAFREETLSLMAYRLTGRLEFSKACEPFPTLCFGRGYDACWKHGGLPQVETEERSQFTWGESIRRVGLTHVGA